MRALPPSIQGLVLLLLSTSAAAITNDFSAYPSGSQDCLTQSADASGCTGDTGTEMNSCLCKNGGNFIYNTASCVAEQSPSDLETVYATLENNCAGTGVTISVGEAAFLAQASAATSSASATATATSTSTSSQTGTSTSSAATASSTASSGLSSGAKIGIGAGIGVAVVGLALIAAFVWWYRRRSNNRNQKAAGDGNGAYAAANMSPAGPHETTAYAGAGYGQYNHQHPPPSSQYASTHPDSAIPLSAMTATSGWNSPSPSAASGMYYKPQDAQHAGQPLLAELGSEGLNQQAPVELYAPHEGSATLSPSAAYGHQHGGGGSGSSYAAELPGTSSTTEPDRFQSPPGTHSPYSPPYERSHF